MLHLLVPAESQDTENEAPDFLELGGRRWVVEDHSNAFKENRQPSYLCVSYACGDQEVPHPLYPSRSISSRAIPVIEAAIREADPDAIWVDAFCVPTEEPAKSEFLGLMGAVYSRAKSVVVVLSDACQPVLKEFKKTGSVSTASLSILENERWINRAWTYQEAVNCDSIRFLTETGSDSGIEAEDLLNFLGSALQAYQKGHGLDGYAFAARYPGVSALEDIILDWKMDPSMERSAFSVLSAMHHRESLNPEEKFRAVIGAISTSTAIPYNLSTLDPAEFFMRVCEEKKDYSFIYSKGPRDLQKPWRPLAGKRMESILPWHSFGIGQAGADHDTHLELEGMWTIEQGPLNPEAIEFYTNWLKLESMPSETQLIDRVVRRLQNLGYDGCTRPMKTRNGFFFTQSKQPDFSELFATVATGVRTAFGGPGLLLRESPAGIHAFQDVGFFVGQVPKAGEVLKIS